MLGGYLCGPTDPADQSRNFNEEKTSGGHAKQPPTTRQPGKKLNDFEKQKRELKTASWGHPWEGGFSLHRDIVPESPHLAGSAGLSIH